jgi:membrane protein
MANFSYKKVVGTSLFMMFGSFVLIGVVNLVSQLRGIYNPEVMPFFWMAMNLITVVAATIIAFNSTNHFSVISKIGAFALIILYLSFFVNQIVILTSDNTSNIFSFLGDYGSAIIDTLIYGSIALLLFGLKIWNPIKYIGVLGYIPSIVTSFTIAKLNDIYSSENYELYESLISRLDTLNYISWGINIATCILIIIWLSKKSIVPSVQSNTIDII